MEGPPLGPGGEDITWPDQVAPRGRKASSTRKIKPQTSNHFLADIPLTCAGMLGRPYHPLLNSLETRADGPPSLSQMEALRPIRRLAMDAAVIGIAIFGCVVWSHGTCGIQTGLCVSADYIWPELRRFSVHPPAYALHQPGRGLALCPECVYTPIYPFIAYFSDLQDMCICMWGVIGPSLKYGPFCPRGDTEAVWGASPIPAAQPVALFASGIFLS